MSEPLDDAELAGLRDWMAHPGSAHPGSGLGHLWPWGNPTNDELVRRLLATIDARDEEIAAMYRAETGLST